MKKDDSIVSVLRRVGRGKLSVLQALDKLKDIPYKNLNFACVDTHRVLRKGFPEVIYCPGKTVEQIEKIFIQLTKHANPILLTKANEKIFNFLKTHHKNLRYNKLACAIYTPLRRSSVPPKGYVLIVTAGTGDIPVAEEARLTLELMNNKVKTLYDVGVAGIHRLLDKKESFRRAKVIIVVAGMEGALPSVVSGLYSTPLIAVPTSVGYGAHFEGLAALLTMLNSCSPGVVVVNINNGFGAGYFASLINR
jgi:hypothetical protein